MPSSVVASMNYNPESRVLRIVFVSGRVYDYKHVPPAVYEQMQLAGSKGTFLNQEIKTKFNFQKVK